MPPSHRQPIKLHQFHLQHDEGKSTQQRAYYSVQALETQSPNGVLDMQVSNRPRYFLSLLTDLNQQTEKDQMR